MYRNIIFDIGNVLLDFKPEAYLKTKISEAPKVSEIYEEVFRSEEWSMLDRGTITENEVINILTRRNSKNADLIKLAFENWYDILVPIEGTVEILKELKKAHYNIYYLSNFHLLAFKYVTKKYDFFNLFDGGVVSYKEKLLKPESDIYRRIIEKYDLKPEESIFIDDTQINTDSAEKLNIGTILFKDPEDLRERLKDYNIIL